MNTKKTISLFLTGLTLYTCSQYVEPVFGEISSSNFKIQGENLSSGGPSGTSATYGLSGDINPFSSLDSSSSYAQQLGYNPRLQAITPEAPTLSNPSNYYQKLHLTINPDNNPSDTLFAIAISNDGFSTYYYVQDDNSIGPTLGTEDYQTYTNWGGASGFNILSLDSNTEYVVKVKALRGDFTETGYSPESNTVATSVPYITLSLSATTAHLSVLSTNSVSETSDITLTASTNADSGYQTYINGTGNGSSGGLFNGTASLIGTSDTTLIAGIEGYGGQASSSTASIAAKYNVIGNTVGAIELTQQNLSSNTTPVSSETTDVRFKATVSGTTIAGEYSDIVYFTIAPNL